MMMMMMMMIMMIMINFVTCRTRFASSRSKNLLNVIFVTIIAPGNLLESSVAPDH